MNWLVLNLKEISVISFVMGLEIKTWVVRLRDQVRSHPNWTIRDVRREAVQWMAQCEGQSFTQKQNDSLYFSNEAQVKVFSEPKSVNQSEYSELRALIEAQQSQLDSLVKALSPLNTGANVSVSLPTFRSKKKSRKWFEMFSLWSVGPYCTLLFSSSTSQTCTGRKGDCNSVGKLEPASVQSHTLVGVSSGSNAGMASTLVSNCPVIEVKFGGCGNFITVGYRFNGYTITESCYNKYFAHLENVPLQDCSWLDLRAGNGLELPYLGYLELDLPSPCTLLSPTWKIRTPMWGCCSWIIVQHLTP